LDLEILALLKFIFFVKLCGYGLLIDDVYSLLDVHNIVDSIINARKEQLSR
jgi:hypothetical protein